MTDFNQDKTCAITGKKVIDTLTKEGLMIPMTDKAWVSNDHKIAKLTELFGEMLDVLGYDRSDEELQDTPKRMAKMWVKELLTAWNPASFPKCTSFDNKGDSGFQDEMVIIKDIKFTSFCAHHTLGYDFSADVAYVVADKMVGISKLNRIVHALSRNLTSQETLGKAIARAIQLVTGSEHVAVRIESSHGCARYRGIADRNSRTLTFAALGGFAEKDSSLRKEFNAAVGSGDRVLI